MLSHWKNNLEKPSLDEKIDLLCTA